MYKIKCRCPTNCIWVKNEHPPHLTSIYLFCMKRNIYVYININISWLFAQNTHTTIKSIINHTTNPNKPKNPYNPFKTLSILVANR